ncbi:MAG: NirD/YgiW/YdeI family stress tolerance protein [Elusimicrobiota bacterium]|jgi:uncharacterized protein (TIGR00156 family)|nr:NirD/YgiW/YdeI family stress tolerance protein [Elusimicrobiota bacterium]
MKLNKNAMLLVLTVFFAFAAYVQAYASAKDKPQGGGYTGAASAQGGYIDKYEQVNAAQAKKLKKNTLVSLIGKIDKRIKGDKYLFSDKTGSVNIEIDDRIWNGLSVGADDTVIIYGEIDKDSGKIEIEVDKIEKR